MREIIYGRNAVRESLRARRRHFYSVMLADNLQPSPVIDEILSLAGSLNLATATLARKKLDQLARGHQGVVLETGRYSTVELEDILSRAARLNEPPFIIGLDHIQDPHNLGAILRTAEAVGVHGVIITKQRAAAITPAVVNASAGAAEHVWVAEVSNLTQTLKKLKQRDIWIAGVENVAEASGYTEANLSGAITLVIGGEGQGLSRLVRETSDFLVKVPMRGQIESLNASVACGLLLYEVRRTRGFGT